MNYELAKQLKDAGFPIIEHTDRPPKNREYISKIDGKSTTRDYLYIPTLSELIEACGNRFLSVNKNFFPRPEKFFASATKLGGGGGINQFGNTPEEAVANLWLALQDNKVKV